jgi:SAM-dependent methyltransferase
MTSTGGLKSNTEWQRWGREDPLWGVVSWANRQKDGDSPWTKEEFYALGESDFQDFFHHWKHYGVGLESCLEIGCGAGRLTRQLAGTFNQVHAVDVSEDMIRLAREAVDAKAQFSLIDGLHLPFDDRSFTAVFSALVIQHLDDVETGLSYFWEFFRVLKPGGTLMIQIPVYQFPNQSGFVHGLMQTMHTGLRRIGSLRADLIRIAGGKLMRVTPYPIQPLIDFLTRLGFADVEIRLFAVKSNGGLYSFVLARKSASAGAG